MKCGSIVVGCLPAVFLAGSIAGALAAAADERPTAGQHFDSMSIDGTVTDEPVALVDDVVTRGATMLGAASRLQAGSPRLEIFGFSAARTVSHGEVDEIFDGLVVDFEHAVATLTEAWGDPAYQGAVDRDDFPAWSEALMLAYWQHAAVVAFVSLRHDDDNEPMFLEIGALTDDEIATLLYTKS